MHAKPWWCYGCETVIIHAVQCQEILVTTMCVLEEWHGVCKSKTSHRKASVHSIFWQTWPRSKSYAHMDWLKPVFNHACTNQPQSTVNSHRIFAWKQDLSDPNMCTWFFHTVTRKFTRRSLGLAFSHRSYSGIVAIITHTCQMAANKSPFWRICPDRQTGRDSESESDDHLRFLRFFCFFPRLTPNTCTKSC